MGAYIEFGTGHSTGEDAYEAGKAAAGAAFKALRKYEPNLVLVFASTKYDLARLIRGVREVTGKTPLIGGTGGGEICQGYRTGGVVVSVIASPYMSVRTGFGGNVSKDYRQAVQDAVDASGAGEYFGDVQSKTAKPELDLDYTKKCFAIVVMPGTAAHGSSHNFEIINMLRKRSLNAFPLVGGCTGDGLKWQESRQFYDDRVLTDSFVLALVETHVKFGVASSANHIPTGLQASITRVEGYEIKEFYYEPAAGFYAKLLGISTEDLKRDARGYFGKNPLGVCDEFGNYTVLMGVEVTPDSGILCTRKPFPNATATVMQLDREKLGLAVGEALNKAIFRGRITKPASCIMFSSAYKLGFLGPDEMKRVICETMTKFRRNRMDMDFSGFVSSGETGVNDEGISVYMDYATSCLVIGDELNNASTVAFKNKILYEELSATAIRNQVLYEEVSAVHEMSNLLSSSLDLKFVVNKAVEMVGKFFQADGCSLFIYDEQSESFRVSGLYNDKEVPKHINWKKTLPYFALVEEKPIIVNEVNGNEVVSQELNKVTKAKSIIAAPIIVKGEKVGVIAAYSREPHFFNNNDLEFLQTLANQVGTALVNAKLFEQTRFLACTDGLTGLYDHNYFLKALSRLIPAAESKKQNLSLIMVDLDDFKYCNDRYGHTVGDIILKETAEILKNSVRNDDIIARYGGDEFAVVLLNATKERAFQIAERIRRRISLASFEEPDSDSTFGITASIGIATFPEDASTAKHLIDSADKAMYRVKRQVKNKSQLYFSDFTELENEFTASEKAFFATIKILVKLLDSRDRYTWEHSRQVAQYAVQLAQELGLSEEEQYWLRLTGYLHDIGKIHVSSEIINKKGRLTNEEFAEIKLHPVVGANLLAPIKGLKKVVPVIYHHHEWFDGSGYPDGLCGYDIPKGARILTVVDGFDAMTSNRPYRKAQTAEWAINELVRAKGTQYDPEIVDVFVRMLRKEQAKAAKRNRRQNDRKGGNSGRKTATTGGNKG